MREEIHGGKCRWRKAMEVIVGIVFRKNFSAAKSKRRNSFFFLIQHRSMPMPEHPLAHTHACIHIHTQTHTHRHIHTDSLQMPLFYWPKLPRNKAKRKETNSQNYTISRENIKY